MKTLCLWCRNGIHSTSPPFSLPFFLEAYSIPSQKEKTRITASANRSLFDCLSFFHAIKKSIRFHRRMESVGGNIYLKPNNFQTRYSVPLCRQNEMNYVSLFLVNHSKYFLAIQTKQRLERTKCNVYPYCF